MFKKSVTLWFKPVALLCVFLITLNVYPILAQHTRQMESMAFSMEWNLSGTLLAVGRNGGKISILDINLQPIHRFSVGEDAGLVNYITWKPDDSEVAAALVPYHPDERASIVFVNISTGNAEIGLSGSEIEHMGRVNWSPSGTQLALSGTIKSGPDSYNPLIEIWNEWRDTRINSWETSAGVFDLRWLGENQLLAVQTDGIFIYNTQTGIPTLSVSAYLVEEPYNAISRDNSKVAVATNPLDNYLSSRIQIWEVPSGTGALDLTLEEHIYGLSWSSNNRYLSVISSDGDVFTIKILDTATGQFVETASELDQVTTISWHPGQKGIAYSMLDNGTAYGIEGFYVPAITNACNTSQTIAAGDIVGLISAINTANANPDANVIGLAAGTYTFTSINNNRNALPRITTDITICSTDGATLTRSPSAPQFRFFEVRSTGNLTLENLTFTNGSLSVDYDGGAIFNLGTLTVNNVTFSNNQAGVGGAIASEDGQVTVTDSTFTNNTSTGDGGAIHSEADLLIETSTFTGNTADDAGAVNNDGGTLTVTDSTFTDNSADDGGAIYNDAGTLMLSGSTFTNNAGDAGGALDNLDGQAQIDSSTFTGNSASDGGAIRNYAGTITLTTSRFTGNMATDDGGALNNSGGTLTITDTRLENNTATTRGGAIYSNSSGTMSAHSSCISGNSATAVYAASTGLQDFTGNWWGAANGPGGAGPGSGDTINSKINHANFLTAGCPLP